MGRPVFVSGAPRSTSFGIVLAAYLAALAAAFVVGLVMTSANPVFTALAADTVATLVIFAFSMTFSNSSLYDPYWSVAPPAIALYWMQVSSGGGGSSVRHALVLWLVVAWGARLTYNWACGWPGLHHEDWRYRELRANARLPYWLVSLGGIHYFPTLQVFLACLPLYAALALGREPWHALDWLALLVTGGAIALETVADEQLRSFNRTKEPGAICARGVWAYSRHPNYLGELGFWWGVWLFGLAAHPAWAWTVIGPVTMTCLFLFASIPMLEERSMARRPGYAEHVQRVSKLVPWRPMR
jgi:steroid 5-alpha reductase family enzyme